MRTEAEIKEQLSAAISDDMENPIFPAMTYAEGVEYALRWVLGQSDTPPMQQE